MTDFARVHSLVASFTMIEAPRLRGLYDAVVSVVTEKLRGDLVECGAAQGGSAALLGLTLQVLGSKRLLWVCDTFEGMPAATAQDPPEAAQYTGHFRGELEEVKGLLKEFGLNFRLVKGLFQDTLPSLKVDKIAVLHLDGDWYESTKCGLENLYDKVVPGGFVQIDDYGHWAGCRKATDEFFQKRGINPALAQLDYTGVQFRKA